MRSFSISVLVWLHFWLHIKYRYFHARHRNPHYLFFFRLPHYFTSCNTRCYVKFIIVKIFQKRNGACSTIPQCFYFFIIPQIVCLPNFLDSYAFDSVYETDDDSLVFDAGGDNQIEIEFFNFNHPLNRTCSIMYWENGKPYIVYL